MQIAIVAAGFTPDEADKLRRAMATFRHVGTIHTFREKFIAGMVGNGYQREFAERCFSQIEGFGEYGFPESHAASFAHARLRLVLDQAALPGGVLRRHPQQPADGLLPAGPARPRRPRARRRGAPPRYQRQRLGLHAGAWLVPSPRLRGAGPLRTHLRERDRGGQTTASPVGDLPVTPNPAPHSAKTRLGRWGGNPGGARCAVRLGLRLVGGLAEEATKETILKARGDGYADIASLWMRSGAPVGMLERLADADVFRSIGLDRRAALWAVKGLDGGALHTGPKRATSADSPLMTWGTTRASTGDLFDETRVDLPETTLGEHVVHDYAAISLSLKAHPVAFFREDLAAPRRHHQRRALGRAGWRAGASAWRAWCWCGSGRAPPRA